MHMTIRPGYWMDETTGIRGRLTLRRGVDALTNRAAIEASQVSNKACLVVLN